MEIKGEGGEIWAWRPLNEAPPPSCRVAALAAVDGCPTGCGTGGRCGGAGGKRLKRERGGVFVDVRARQPKVHVACGSAALNETT